MSLYLVQHGKSLSKDVDPDQSLSEEGISEVNRIAEAAKNYGVRVNRIEHSGKTRARQTAEIFASTLSPVSIPQERSGIGPLDDVADIAKKLDTNENLMLVGHLPFMERITSYLITGAIEPRVFKFQNGGILCLDLDAASSTWHIKWAIMPTIN